MVSGNNCITYKQHTTYKGQTHCPLDSRITTCKSANIYTINLKLKIKSFTFSRKSSSISNISQKGSSSNERLASSLWRYIYIFVSPRGDKGQMSLQKTVAIAHTDIYLPSVMLHNCLQPKTIHYYSEQM